MFREEPVEIPLDDVKSLGIDFVGYDRLDGELGKGLVHPYGVFLITEDGELYLLARCQDLLFALTEVEELLNKWGYDWNVLLSDGCKAILQCSFMAGEDWAVDWFADGDNVTQGGSDEE